MIEQTSIQAHYNVVRGIDPEKATNDYCRRTFESLSPYNQQRMLAVAIFMHFCEGDPYEGRFGRGILYGLWGAWEYSIAFAEKFFLLLAQAWHNWTLPKGGEQ